MSISNILHIKTFFEMSRDDHPRHSSKNVHFKYLAYLTSKCLEILSQTPNYLKLVQKIRNRKYLYNCKLYTIEVVLMGPKSHKMPWSISSDMQSIHSHNLRQGQKTTGRRKRSHVPANSGSTIPWCTRLWHPLAMFLLCRMCDAPHNDILAMCLLCRLCDSEEVFILGFHWINRKAVRLSAIPLMSQNSRLYNLSLESLARLSLHEHIQKACERLRSKFYANMIIW
jgi:hypothetical protein